MTGGLYIEPTKSTPKVVFEPEEGLFLIEGISIPGNSHIFYAPVSSWFKEYCEEADEPIALRIELEYFNSSTYLSLMDLMKCMLKFQGPKKVVWVYETDDSEMKDTGQMLADKLDIRFEFEEKLE